LTAIVAVSIVLGLTALLFVVLLVGSKLYDRSLINSQFRRRYLIGTLVALSLWQFANGLMKRHEQREMLAHVSLVRRVDPVYPPLARQARIEGMVQFDAVINANGRVEKLDLISGHPMLIAAAKDAIFQWQYSELPFRVHTVIQINFVLKPTP
jgi:TonB family protein